MGGERQTGMRRHAVRAIELCRCVADGEQTSTVNLVDFIVRCPDERVSLSLVVLFQPDPSAFAHPEPGNTLWDDIFTPVAGNETGLAIMSRETAEEQGGKSLFADPVFGTLSVPVPLPGDTFGWLVSGRPDGKEWYCRLKIKAPTSPNHPGTWFARVVATDATAGMKPHEWERVADKLYLLGIEAQIPRFRWGGA